MLTLRERIPFAEVLREWGQTECPDLDALSPAAEQHVDRARYAIEAIRAPIIDAIPANTSWSLVHLAISDLNDLRLIFAPDWGHLCAGDGSLGKFIQTFPGYSPGHSGEVSGAIVLFRSGDGPTTVLEGNHRLIAAAKSGRLGAGIRVYLGASPDPCRWHRPFAFQSETRNATERENTSLRRADAKYAAFTTDDGYENVARALPDVLGKHGTRATFYVHCDRAVTSSRSLGKIMDNGIFRWLQERNQEIGGHSFHHVSWPSLTDQERLVSLREMFSFLGDLNIIPRTFAYPFGHVDANTLELISSFFETAVLAGPLPNNTSSDPHLLSRIPIEQDWDLAAVKAAVERHAARVGGAQFAIFMIHHLPTRDVMRLEALMLDMMAEGWSFGSVSDCWSRINATVR